MRPKIIKPFWDPERLKFKVTALIFRASQRVVASIASITGIKPNKRLKNKTTEIAAAIQLFIPRSISSGAPKINRKNRTPNRASEVRVIKIECKVVICIASFVWVQTVELVYILYSHLMWWTAISVCTITVMIPDPWSCYRWLGWLEMVSV